MAEEGDAPCFTYPPSGVIATPRGRFPTAIVAVTVLVAGSIVHQTDCPVIDGIAFVGPALIRRPNDL